MQTLLFLPKNACHRTSPLTVTKYRPTDPQVHPLTHEYVGFVVVVVVSSSTVVVVAGRSEREVVVKMEKRGECFSSKKQMAHTHILHKLYVHVKSNSSRYLARAFNLMSVNC
jgi:hypothetical protein